MRSNSESSQPPTASQQNLTTIIEIDATSVSRRLELVVTNASSATSLEVGIAAATVNV